MPYSDFDGKDEIVSWVRANDIKTVLDVGAGAGTYAILFKENNITLKQIDGVEIWEPYLNRYVLKEHYTNIFLSDIRDWGDFTYDLVIFGDVLEHMSKEDAISLWDRTSKSAKYAIISIPIVHLPQGAWEGNHYEKHVKDDWTTSEVLDTFSNIVEYFEFDVIGVFFAIFTKQQKDKSTIVDA
jgi:SAM-dependent methyltransferase